MGGGGFLEGYGGVLFKFLGFQIILVRRGITVNQPYKVKIIPSKDNRSRFLDKVRTVIRKAKAWSSYDLIRVLKPIFIGWANYFRFCECNEVFKTLDNAIFGMLRAWAFRRDTRSGRLVIKQKYFPSGIIYNFQGRTYADNWVLSGKTKNDLIVFNFLPRLSWIQSSKHVKVISNKSPFDGDYLYWAKRLTKYSGLPYSTIKMLKSQQFKCPICNAYFVQGEIMEIDHIIPKSLGGKDNYGNLQLLHRICHVGKTRDEKLPLVNVPDIEPSKSEKQYFSEYTLDEIYAMEGF